MTSSEKMVLSCVINLYENKIPAYDRTIKTLLKGSSSYVSHLFENLDFFGYMEFRKSELLFILINIKNKGFINIIEHPYNKRLLYIPNIDAIKNDSMLSNLLTDKLQLNTSRTIDSKKTENNYRNISENDKEIEDFVNELFK